MTELNNANDSVDNSQSEISFDPFDQPVIQREYAQKPMGTATPTTPPATQHVGAGAPPLWPPIEEDIPAAQFNQVNVRQEDSEMGELLGTNISDTGVPLTGGQPPKKEPMNKDLKDLSQEQKRKAAKETAKALMTTYCQVAPLPFKHFSKISNGKVTKLALEGRIDLDMKLTMGETTSLTVKEYIDNHNTQVEGIFKVPQETRESIEEPLTDVLMEQGMALTPTQRLVFALGMHITQMTISTANMASQSKHALETFTRFHLDVMAKKEAEKEVSKQSESSTSESDYKSHENSRGETVIEVAKVEVID